MSKPAGSAGRRSAAFTIIAAKNPFRPGRQGSEPGRSPADENPPAMRLSILAVGRLKSGPERELLDRYAKRIEGMGRGLGIAGPDVVELPQSRARRDDDRRAEEAAAILERAGSSALIVFDERGKSPTSEAFAERVRAWRDEGRTGLT